MFFLEGCNAGNSMNWGDDFEPDDGPFFTELRQQPYKDLVVLSPHIYPPSIADSGSPPGSKWVPRAHPGDPIQATAPTR